MMENTLTTTVGTVHLVGSGDLVGLQGKNSEMILTAAEFEELARRYAEWRTTRHDVSPVLSAVFSPRSCPACPDGRVVLQWNGVRCGTCGYENCL